MISTCALYRIAIHIKMGSEQVVGFVIFDVGHASSG